MRKASYTSRKMTNQERNTAVEYYHLLFYFIKKKRLDKEEWCSRLHIPYVYAIMKYTDYERLHYYPIEIIILKSLEWAWRSEVRKGFRLKRRPSDGIESYNGKENYIFYNAVSVSSGEMIGSERNAISNFMLEIIAEKIETEQRKQIIDMLLNGYKKIEIQKEMDITYYYLHKEIKIIRILINEIYHGECL